MKLLSTVICILVGWTQVSAHVLEYNVGDAAFFSVEQDIDLAWDGLGLRTEGQEQLLVGFELIVLNTNPLQVRVQCKNIKFATAQTLDLADEKQTNEYIAYLKSIPLNFTINGDFQIKETTEALSTASLWYEESSLAVEMGSFFESVLTQIFQLHDQKLQMNHSYATDCYQFLNWAEEPQDVTTTEIKQDSHVKIVSIDDSKIVGLWNGLAQAHDTSGMDFSGQVKVAGKVAWSTQNPLVQNRYLCVDVEEDLDSYFSIKVNLRLVQHIIGK